MMQAVPRARQLTAERAGELPSATRRKDPAARAQLDDSDFNFRTKGQLDFLSHAFLCTEDTTLAIRSAESDEDPH